MKTGNAGMRQQIAVDVMKKAMDLQAREVLSALQSSDVRQTPSSPSAAPPNVAAVTGLGQKIDIKA